MKFKTFESLLQNCADLYKTGCDKDTSLSEAFGGNTSVMQDWWSKFIEDIISSIESEYNDKSESVQWLFWESMLNSDGYLDFEKDGIIYGGSPENIFMDLNNMLDEKFSKGFAELDYDSDSTFKQKLTKEDIVEAHDKDKLKEVDMTHLVKDESSQSTNIMNETSKEDSKENVFNLKLITLQEKQIQLASVMLSDILKERMKEILTDDTDFEEFKRGLDTHKDLELDSKHKDTLIKMKRLFEMVLVQFVGDKLDKNVCGMIKFEVEKTLNNLKNMRSIFDYKVHEADIKDGIVRVEGRWVWEGINERPKTFSVEVGEGIKIEFK